MRTINFLIGTSIYLFAALLIAMIADNRTAFFFGVALIAYPIIHGWWMWFGIFIVFLLIDITGYIDRGRV
jgi:ABC-type multidrug transport system permease subunit